MTEYTDSKTLLGKTVSIIIDRPFGSTHPKHKNIIYQVNYGYVPDTLSPDGEELDAYLLGVFEPVKTFKGNCIAIIKRSDDNDDKLIIAPTGATYTDEQIREQTYFQEQYFKSEILRL